jgi:hypothetical protein
MYLCKECIEQRKYSIVCHAFTGYACEDCKGYFNHQNTGVPRICNGCAVTQNKCQKCKKEVNHV